MQKPRSSTNITISALRSALVVTLVTSLAAPLAAQTPEQRRLDSLQLRLEDAEAMLELLQQQLATEAESGVRTRSRIGLELSGRVLMNVFMNNKETNNADVPMYRKQVPDGSLKGGMGMTVRQTTLGGAITVHEVLGGTFRGDLDVDFFGGQVPSPGGRTFPLMRVRTARAIVEWENSELLIGQEQPLVAGLNPLSLASVGAPNFSYAGNLWLWLPQIRYGIRSQGALRFGAQAAVLAPTSAQPADFFATGFDDAERTGVPFAQARLHLGWGDEANGAEIGVGYHSGQVNNLAEEAQPSTAVTVDFLIPFLEKFEVLGEAYSGQVLAGLGGGGIGHNFGVDSLTPLRTVGGWAQLNYRISPRLLVGAGYGFDDPNDDDVPQLLLNATQEVHLHWRPSGPLVFGLEWRSTRTRYDASDYPNTHINLAFGFEF
jgi:hypothetical protein